MTRRNNNPFLQRVIKCAVIVVVLVSMTLFVLTFAFRIKQVKVEGVAAQQFPQQQLKFLHNKSLFFTNFEKTPLFTNPIKNEQGQIFIPKKISKKLPSTIIIRFQQEDPLYRLQWRDETYLINSNDFLGQDDDSFDLTLVSVSSNYDHLIKGDKLDSQLNSNIQLLLKYLERNDLHPKEIFLDQHQSYLQVDQTRFIFEDEADFSVLTAKMKTIVANLDYIREQVPDYNEIDLRFDLPVVENDQENVTLTSTSSADIEVESVNNSATDSSVLEGATQ